MISSLLPSFPWYGSDEEKAKLDPAYHLKTTNLETRETLAELYKDYKGDQLLASTSKEPEAKKTDKLNAVSKNFMMAFRETQRVFCFIEIPPVYGAS